jgi:hypothetical protein
MSHDSIFQTMLFCADIYELKTISEIAFQNALYIYTHLLSKRFDFISIKFTITVVLNDFVILLSCLLLIVFERYIEEKIMF